MKNFILLLSSISVCLIMSTISYAKSNSNLLLNLKQCSTVLDNDSRLLCFDKLVTTHTKQFPAAVTKVTPPVAIDNKSVEKNRIDNFAKEHLNKTKKEQSPDSIFATVVKVKKLLRGQLVIYLANGQKWQQTNTARLRLKVGNKVRLTKGALGVIYLYKENSHRSIKVKRLK